MNFNPNPVDVHVGRQVRLRRKSLGISQERLATSLGLTFQQVQKYERGANRISASKLYQVARALRIEVSYFFAGLPSPTDPDANDDGQSTSETVGRLLFEPHGLMMAEAFPRIRNQGVKKRLADLARVIAANEDPPADASTAAQ